MLPIASAHVQNVVDSTMALRCRAAGCRGAVGGVRQRPTLCPCWEGPQPWLVACWGVGEATAIICWGWVALGRGSAAAAAQSAARGRGGAPAQGAGSPRQRAALPQGEGAPCLDAAAPAPGTAAPQQAARSAAAAGGPPCCGACQLQGRSPCLGQAALGSGPPRPRRRGSATRGSVASCWGLPGAGAGQQGASTSSAAAGGAERRLGRPAYDGAGGPLAGALRGEP